MTESLFDDKATPPGDRILAQSLGRRRALWEALTGAIETAAGEVAPKWSFYTKTTGWILLLQRKKKTLCTLIPCEKTFDVIFLLPERAVEEARAARLPRRVLDAIEEAKPYKIGRPFRVHVAKQADLGAVRKLAAIKARSWKR